MRWTNLSIEAEQRARLPGYRDEVVVRHFEAPDSVRTRFYEVHAKSILNRVPAASRMPFRWTINPYRGCSHACSYCVLGDTPILTANGRHKPISELDVGDAIYGTERAGSYRRYAVTSVLDKWMTVKPAYRVVLEDGTELITSGDHRLLSNRGWKHVINTPPGARDRPYLTMGNCLMGTGRFAPQPEETPDYRRGYLCGVSRDGQLETNEWPLSPSLDWSRGFLAGIFDAEGTRSAFALRIANNDQLILAWTEACAQRLGFDVTVEPRNNGVRSVRVRGGLSEQLRFLHLTDPAITRKRSIEGRMVKTFADLRVAAIEPLGDALPLYDITTGTGDFIANGVISHNCFARPTHRYLDFDAGRDFERRIVVKVNAPERLRVELARPSWQGEHVALGTNTDPYQWVEGRYRLMRGIWEAMLDAGNPCSVLTKSPLLLRDLDLFKELAAVTEFSAALSIPTLDEKAWRATEPHTPHPRARLDAVAKLTQAGIRTGILVAPLMPGINDAPEQLEPLLALAAEAGAAYVTGIPLHLRGEVRDVFFEWLRADRPDLLDRYETLYDGRAYLRPSERERLAGLVRGSDPRPWERMRGRRMPAVRADPPAPRRPEQQRLF